MATSRSSKPKDMNNLKGPTWDQLTEQQKIDVDAMFTTIYRINMKYRALNGGKP